MKITDSEMMDFIEDNEAQVTQATSEPPDRRWRCYVYPQTFASPDSRERSGRCGFGRTAREAIVAAMSPKGIIR